MPLLLLLLFLCCASVCVAQKDGGVQSTGVVRELPRKGQSGVQAYTVATQKNEGWELIRIKAFTKDLENTSRYCNEENKEIKKYDGELYKCRDKEDVLGVDTMKKFEDIIIPAAMKLHEDRLFVRRGSGKLRVPQFQDESYCKHFTVPDEHHSDGVDNADFVLYVAAVPLSSFGVTCAVENSTGRPIVGAVNYAPTTYEYMRFDVRRVAQLIAHALGFNLPEMERKGIVTEVELRGAKRKVVNSSKTVEKAQKHYNCSNLKGMELGTKGDDTRVYWLRHIARDELMTPMSVYNYGAGYYTALTMALFEDLQYYKANWGMEEQMSWGNQSGCDFLHKWCIVENKVRYPEYFCNETIFRCRSDRLAYAPCSVPASMIVVPEDICHTSGDYPYVDRSGNHLTTYYCDDNTTDEVAGSIMGPDSFCLDAEELKIEGAANAILNQNGVCARVLCDYEKRTVSVKYNGSDTFKECPEGSSIDVKSSVFESGKIKCPKYDEVCIIAFNGSSRVPFVVNRPPASSAAAEESASSVDTSLQKDQENKESASTADHAPASTSSTTNSMNGSRRRRDIGAADNASTPTKETQAAAAAGTTSPSGEENANTNALSQYPGVVNQAQINNMQNESKLLIELAKDDALSAVCSLPIMIVTMVLAVVLSC